MQPNRGFVERRAKEAKRPIWKHKKISVIDAKGEFGQLRAMHLQYLGATEIAEFAKQTIQHDLLRRINQMLGNFAFHACFGAPNVTDLARGFDGDVAGRGDGSIA